MLMSRKTTHLFVLLVITLFISLIFVPAAWAQLTVNGMTKGSVKSSINDSVRLFAENGTGSYSWSKEGGGSLSCTDNECYFNYTTPTTNTDCKNNAKVCVMDSKGQKVCITIAVNTYYGTKWPRAYWVYSYGSCGQVSGTDSCHANSNRDAYNCNMEYVDTTYTSGCEFPYHTANYSISFSACCEKCWLCDQTYNRYVPGIPIDIRSPEQKADGCCPAAVFNSGDPGANDTGDNCSNSADTGSSGNFKSGNLHHSQNVGILTLSYNSIDTINGVLGKKWTHQYNQSLTSMSSGAILTLKTEDGNVIDFTMTSGVYYPTNISGDTSRIVKNADNTYTRTTKHNMTYRYNPSGQLTSVADRNGNTTTLAYSGSALALITDPNGRTWTITTTSGVITGVTDALSRTYTLSYDVSDVSNKLLTSVTPPIGNAWTYTYDSEGRMLTKTDPAGFTITYVYTSDGKIQSSTDPENKTRSMSYTSSTQTTFTEKDGSAWNYTYDPVYAVKTAKADPLGNTTTYTYDDKRNLTGITYPDSTYTGYTYDANGNMLTMTDQMGHTTIYTYNSLNLVATMIDPRGFKTIYGYDTSGNLTSVTFPADAQNQGPTTYYTYYPQGNIHTITDTRGKPTSFEYDAQNNLTAIVDAYDKRTTFTYDAVGNRLTALDRLGRLTRYFYNELNQMTKVTDPGLHDTYFTYDYKGNILTATDARSRTTGYTYNHRGNLTRITDALSNQTNMTYGPTGCSSGCGGADKITALTDALSHTTSYTYDAAGRLTQETDPLSGTTTYTYDGNGRMLTKTKPDNRTITYTYDNDGRMLTRVYPGGATDTFTYDENGNILTAANAVITYSYGYDAANRMTGATAITGGNTRAITYAYDNAGNRTSMLTPDNVTTSYVYDDAGRLTSITNNTGAYAFAYDFGGRRTTLTYPGGATATYTYDANSNLLNVLHARSGATLLQPAYTYDQVNNRITRTDTLPTSSGNNLQENMTYDNANEQLNINTATYTYDANGNRASKTEGTTVTTYTYDDENRLIQVSANGATIATYAYDPFGRRIQKNVDGTITQYLYDNASIILEYNAANQITARYTHGPGIDEPLALQLSSGTYYYHADGLGSIGAMTNTSGAVVQTYIYDDFGIIKQQTGSIIQPYTYTAREYDAETGLYYYRARYYDAKAGRFITRDPISFAGGDVNLYAYVGNNPVNRVDPEGLRNIPGVIFGASRRVVGLSPGAIIMGNFFGSSLNLGENSSLTSVYLSANKNRYQEWDENFFYDKLTGATIKVLQDDKVRICIQGSGGCYEMNADEYLDAVKNKNPCPVK